MSGPLQYIPRYEIEILYALSPDTYWCRYPQEIISKRCLLTTAKGVDADAYGFSLALGSSEHLAPLLDHTLFEAPKGKYVAMNIGQH
jgi:hypothetical protein